MKILRNYALVKDSLNYDTRVFVYGAGNFDITTNFKVAVNRATRVNRHSKIRSIFVINLDHFGERRENISLETPVKFSDILRLGSLACRRIIYLSEDRSALYGEEMDFGRYRITVDYDYLLNDVKYVLNEEVFCSLYPGVKFYIDTKLFDTITKDEMRNQEIQEINSEVFIYKVIYNPYYFPYGSEIGESPTSTFRKRKRPALKEPAT